MKRIFTKKRGPASMTTSSAAGSRSSSDGNGGGIVGTGGSRSATSSTRYQYAMRHYQDTVDPMTGDVDAKGYQRYENPMNDTHVRIGTTTPSGGGTGGGEGVGMESVMVPMAESSDRRSTPDRTDGASVGGIRNGGGGGGGNGILGGAPDFEKLTGMEEGTPSSSSSAADGRRSQSAHDIPPARVPSYSSDENDFTKTYVSGSGSLHPPDPNLPDIYYEEHYGDAYVGSNIKYIYPAGYQSMKPRSRPWKLSIGVFCLFTWLTVFIVGHCSDVAGDQYSYLDDTIDDDAVELETRWCGSRMLYFTWVMSVLITGLSCAYCSIIGYIQVRDFGIANGRSQPPCMAGHNSDYYVNIGDGGGGSGRGQGGGGAGGVGSSHHGASYQTGERTIYQSDGMPQFWGSHIYKPTQAAVAVTSR